MQSVIRMSKSDTKRNFMLFVLAVVVVGLVLSQAVMSATGGQTTSSSGAAYSMGRNHWGVTGQGNRSDIFLVPTQIGEDEDWAEISAGQSNTLFLKSDGTMYSTGYNNWGATGLGLSSGFTYVPTQVGTDDDWVQISMSSQSAFGLKSDGTLYSWGRNVLGRTAQGTEDGFFDVPTQVGTDDDWKTVSAQGAHGLAIKEDGSMYGFGNNTDGRVGLGVGSPTLVLSPTRIGTDNDWAQVSAVGLQSLALKKNGTLWSFGDGLHGAIGQGPADTDFRVPTQVGTGNNWVKISSSSSNSMALKSDGTLWAFGSNEKGLTGQGTLEGKTSVPTQVGTDDDWADISLGDDHAILLKEDGSIYSMGSNTYGATGHNAETEITLFPTRVGTESKWTKISAGFTTSILLGSTEDALATTTTTLPTTSTTIPGGNGGMTSHIDLVSAANGEDVRFEFPKACTQYYSRSVTVDELSKSDENFSYPSGLVSFSLDCPDPAITVSQYYFGLDYSADVFNARKFLPYNSTFIELDGASVEDVIVDDRKAIKVTYSLTDGGIYDADQEVNGTFVDPAGLALREGALPMTGANSGQTIFIASAIAISGLAIVLVSSRRKKNFS